MLKKNLNLKFYFLPSMHSSYFYDEATLCRIIFVCSLRQTFTSSLLEVCRTDRNFSQDVRFSNESAVIRMAKELFFSGNV